MLSVKEKIITGTKTKEVFTVAQRYNDLGQLQSKWLHAYGSGTKYRRRIDYTNNIRGWQTDAKTVYKPATAELPFYSTHVSYRNGANYSNGSVDSLAWRNKDENAFSAGLKFTYDGASRLAGSTGIFGNTNTESGISYDKNGNISTLTRSGVAVDNLTYTYLGNRLSAVGDASGDNTGVKNGGSNYLYDANGNMLSDGNRGATLTYNYLNLPKTITIGANPAFTYDYDASGAKHKYANSADAFIAKYAGIIEYDGTNAFKRAATSEGQVILTPDSLTFNYYIKDHLGNLRIVFNENGEVLQNTEYYPFGMAVAKDGNAPAVRNNINRYTFLGRENQVGTDYMDLKRRFYDPATGRFISIDPVTDGQEHQSTYQYGWNNPLRFKDPDGMWPWDALVSAFNKWYNVPLNKFQQDISRAASIGGTPAKTQGEVYKNALITGLAYAASGVQPGSFRRPADMYKTVAKVASSSGSITGLARMGNQQDVPDVPQGGAARSARYSSGWSNGSLREALSKFAPGSEGVTLGQKTLYPNSESGIQVVVDNTGNYFRIQDTNVSGKRQYLDMNGNIPNNKLVDGRQMGRSQAEYNQITHFNINDD
jgi:RHS repeat-associated protein